ncbi:hypothetical protein GCM10023148_00900 [Actinokineospora soli]
MITTPAPQAIRLGAIVVGCVTVAATCFGWVAAEIKDERRNRGPVPIPTDAPAKAA